VLRGWGASPDVPARHDITVKDVRVRNVPTNIRDWRGGTERHGAVRDACTGGHTLYPRFDPSIYCDSLSFATDCVTCAILPPFVARLTPSSN